MYWLGLDFQKNSFVTAILSRERQDTNHTASCQEVSSERIVENNFSHSHTKQRKLPSEFGPDELMTHDILKYGLSQL